MDTLRLILIVLLTFIGMLLWQAWERDYGPRPVTANSAQTAATKPDSEGARDLPPVAKKPDVTKAPEATSSSASDQRVQIRTDLFDIEIAATGGVIGRAALRHYPLDLKDKDQLFSLLGRDATRDFVAQAGLKAEGESPDHYAVFSVDHDHYEMGANDDTLVVPMRWRSASGVEVVRELEFKRGSYTVTQRFRVTNRSEGAWKFHHYEQLQRVIAPAGRQLVPTFTGAAISTPEERYRKVKFESLSDAPLEQDVAKGWLALIEHYFVAALLPDEAQSHHYYATALGNQRYVVGFYGPETSVAAGADAMVQSRLYLGPKLQETLAQVAPGLDLTVDYGMLWFIAKLLFWTMTKFHALFGNWGWSIIALTVLIKVVFYPLSAAGYRSMARMKAVQPRLLQIRERYADDRARLNQAMMDLYRNEKINPLGGCLPILVQIPVFISLYWMILETVELRQAPFLLWIQDLSLKDPFYVLPVLMLISMWFQTKMNPVPPDPIQAKVMQIMPFAFGIFFAFFPAGLVLYWFVNNVLSIAQQWYITRQIEQGATQGRA